MFGRNQIKITATKNEDGEIDYSYSGRINVNANKGEPIYEEVNELRKFFPGHYRKTEEEIRDIMEHHHASKLEVKMTK